MKIITVILFLAILITVGLPNLMRFYLFIKEYKGKEISRFFLLWYIKILRIKQEMHETFNEEHRNRKLESYYDSYKTYSDDPYEGITHISRDHNLKFIFNEISELRENITKHLPYRINHQLSNHSINKLLLLRRELDLLKYDIKHNGHVKYQTQALPINAEKNHSDWVEYINNQVKQYKND